VAFVASVAALTGKPNSVKAAAVALRVSKASVLSGIWKPIFNHPVAARIRARLHYGDGFIEICF
jgi:hypothetical protein